MIKYTICIIQTSRNSIMPLLNFKSIFILLVVLLRLESITRIVAFTTTRIHHQNHIVPNDVVLQRSPSSILLFREKLTYINHQVRMARNDVDGGGMRNNAFDDSKNVVMKSNNKINKNMIDSRRRTMWMKTAVQMLSIATIGTIITTFVQKASASSDKGKSRTDGYTVQKSDKEWKDLLSPIQYYVLRDGGTERPGYSILDKEDRNGIYKCAGCESILFNSNDKFNSGTGWPSFARGNVDNVEIENVNVIQASIAGAELRCQTCGGHLGDIFSDGYLFVGTEAFITGKRYCIDGAALIFYPNDNDINNNIPISGDQPKYNKKEQQLPNVFDSPKIIPRSRDEII